MKNTKIKFDFWTNISIVIACLFLLFLIYPLFSLFISGFQNSTGQFSLEHFIKFFTRKYYYKALLNSFMVTICTTFLVVIIGAPLAYLTSAYKIKGKQFLDILIIISMLSPAFIGAYSWIILFGRSGVVTKFIESLFGFTMPSIYGFGGILIVMTLKLYPFIYLYTTGALKKLDASLIEAAESLGCSPLKKVSTVVIPLITPTILASGLLVFMNALADFGTPMLIGEGFVVMPVLVYNEFISEVGGTVNFAAAISVIMVVITIGVFSLQKYIVNKKSFTMNSLRPIQPKELKGIHKILAHTFVYLIVFLSVIPQLTVIFTSFKATKGSVFVPGFSLDSYKTAFSKLGEPIVNTYIFGFIAIICVVVLAIFIAYIVIRRKNPLTTLIDSASMLPYIIPGSVLGITLLLAFNERPLLLSGTSFIMILAFVVRRLPYTLRSSAAILYQISPSMEEAAISLGDSSIKAFFKVTVIMMLPGVMSGAIMSWITIINELSASVILYTANTRTMSVTVYTNVIRASYGSAAAVATILTITTIISLIVFFKVSGKKDIGL
ncbi:MAG: ABC transporter permease [Lachnospirales bacterium]